MPEAKPRYFIGPALLGDIRRVVGRSDETPRNAGGQAPPSRSVDVLATHGPEFRVGRKSGAWTKGTTATLTWTVGGTVNSSLEATNLFADITGGTATYNCAVGRVGGQWYLIAAECEDGTAAQSASAASTSWFFG